MLVLLTSYRPAEGRSPRKLPQYSPNSTSLACQTLSKFHLHAAKILHVLCARDGTVRARRATHD